LTEGYRHFFIRFREVLHPLRSLQVFFDHGMRVILCGFLDLFQQRYFVFLFR
jgi:hypothetical protein